MDSKKIDKWLMIISSVLLIIGLSFIIYCINYVGSLSTTQKLLFFVGTIFIAFFSGYLILLLIMRIFQSIFKKLSNHFKVDIFLKLLVWIIISIILLVLIREYFEENNYNSPTNLIKFKIIPTALNNPFKEYCSNPIIFDKSTYIISRNSITDTQIIKPEQIIFINPQILDKFEITADKLRNKNLFPKYYNICSICDTKENISEFLNNYEITDTIIDSNIEGETLCLVYPSLFYPKTF